MTFLSLKDFFYMGGYATYVWMAYGLTLFFLVNVLYQALRRQRKIWTQLQQIKRDL